MISTKGRYAVRVMLDLARHNTGGLVPLKDIAARQEISKKYLEIIVRDLVAEGLLTGTSGKGGGYRLSRPPQAYNLGEIIEAAEGPLDAVACLSEGAPPCPRAARCESVALWAEYSRLTHDFFYGKRLTDLIKTEGGEG